MKNIYFIAALAVLAFSACSDDKDSTEGACYVDKINPAVDISMCFEGTTESLTSSDCAEISQSYGLTASFRNSCPSGHKLKCDVEGGEGYAYFYGDAVAMFTCQTLLPGM